MKRLLQQVLLAVAALALFALPAAASPKADDPDPAATPVLAQLIETGAKIFYLGKTDGIDGWFIIKGGQVQIGYTTPDKQNVIFGVMVDRDGQSMSALQVKTAYDNNPEVGTLLNGLNNQPPVPAPGASGSQLPGMTPQVMALANSMSATPSIASPSLAASPGERLWTALEAAPGVNVGAASAPKIAMVIDPYCPHCHATWKALRDYVLNGKLQIRLVPVGVIDPDSERAAAQLLGSADPLSAWDKYVDGDQAQLAGTPDATELASVRSNRALVDSWHIQMTPYLVYRAKDGQMKIEQGEPKQPAALVGDIAP